MPADIASLLGRLGGGAPGGGAPGGMPGGAPGGPPPAPGAAPPGMAGAKPNMGPATSPQPNRGNEAAAMGDIENALKMLEKALPSLPIGSDLHTEILKVTTQLSKKLQPGGGGSPGLQLQSLLQMARQQSQSAPMQALARMQQPADAPPAMPGGGAPGGAPPMPMAA